MEEYVEFKMKIKRKDLIGLQFQNKKFYRKNSIEKMLEQKSSSFYIIFPKGNIKAFITKRQKQANAFLEKNPPRIKPWVQDLISQWNSYPTVTKHKKGKIILQLQKKFIQLREGTFGKKNKINSEFIKQHKLQSQFINKRFSLKQLQEGIRRLSLLSVIGYWPPDKKGVKNLDTLLFNSWTGSSMFLKVMKNAPIPFSEIDTVEDKYPDITKKFLNKIFNDMDLTSSDHKKLKIGIQSLVEYQKKIKIPHPKYRRIFGSALALCITYIEYIECQDWLFEKGFNTGIINTRSGIFKNFLKELEEIYPITLPR